MCDTAMMCSARAVNFFIRYQADHFLYSIGRRYYTEGVRFAQGLYHMCEVEILFCTALEPPLPPGMAADGSLWNIGIRSAAHFFSLNI
jgi:hypothetical protein